jgi:SulP family sulfate permease
MSEAKHFIRILRVAPRDDIVALLVCFFLTIIFDMSIAIGVGMGVAAILFIRRSIDLTESIIVTSEHSHETVSTNKIVIYDINGPLFFGSAHKAIHSITSVAPEVRVVILDMSEVTMLDMSAIVAMESIVKNLTNRGLGIVINNLKPHMIIGLRRSGLRARKGVVSFSRSINEGIEKAAAMF